LSKQTYFKVHFQAPTGADEILSSAIGARSLVRAPAGAHRLQAPAGGPPAGACVLALGAPIVLKITKISIFLKKNRQNVPSAIGADDRRLQAPTGVSTGADRRLSSAPTGVCSADRRLSLSLALGTSADRRQ